MNNNKIRFSIVFVVSLCFCWAAGAGLHRLNVSNNNNMQMEELAQQLLRRTEKALDYVVIAQTELLLAGHNACDDVTISSLRQLVVDTGTISNIFMLSNGRSCSSFEDLNVVLPAVDQRRNWRLARNPAYRLGRIKGANQNAIGVAWGFGTDLEIVVAINANTILFDILPNALRDTGLAELSIGDEKLAIFEGDGLKRGDEVQLQTYVAGGQRYPLVAKVSVAAGALAQWHNTVSTPIALAWSAFGLLVSGMFAWASVRGRDQGVALIADALRRREIVPHFQSIIDLESGDVIGAEVLARWIKPDGEQISPGRFIPLVEQHGLDHQLLSRMMEGAAEALRGELDKSPSFFLSFNVTPDQLSDPTFGDQFEFLVDSHGLRAEQICIEVTERQAITAPEQAVETTKRLAKAGFRIAIDDAGTGHNGLAAIQMLDASKLKIDKFFIDQVQADARSRVMIDMFVSVAQRYGMKTVAEGVETEEQAEALKLAGVDAVQGFLFAKPMSGDDFIEKYSQSMPGKDAAAGGKAAA